MLGDLVLRKVTLSTKEPGAGKLGLTWEGPYKVVKVSKSKTYLLEDMDRKNILHPWNAEHLKKLPIKRLIAMRTRSPNRCGIANPNDHSFVWLIKIMS